MIERGSSLKFCLIAQGDADIYVRMGPTCIWDTAAGHAILVSAGGQVAHAKMLHALTYTDPRQVLNPPFIAYAPSEHLRTGDLLGLLKGSAACHDRLNQPQVWH